MAATDEITRGDIEAKLREIRKQVDEGTEQARSYALAAGAVAVVVVLGVGYLMGKRRGRKKTTVVEIQRV